MWSRAKKAAPYPEHGRAGWGWGEGQWERAGHWAGTGTGGEGGPEPRWEGAEERL